MSERVGICERVVRRDGHEGLCLRRSGHKGDCICLRKHAAEAEAFARGVAAMRKAAATRVYEIYRGCSSPDAWVTVTDIKALAEEIESVLPTPEDES